MNDSIDYAASRLPTRIEIATAVAGNSGLVLDDLPRWKRLVYLDHADTLLALVSNKIGGKHE